MPRKAQERSIYRYKINPVQKFRAKEAIGPYFMWDCPAHGQTQFLSAENCCRKCYDANPAVQPRIRAALAKAEFYQDFCPDCGPGRFYVKIGLCAFCYTSIGRSRGDKVRGARAEARSKGERLYMDACLNHGVTEFHVTVARCARCFTAGGAPRRKAGQSRRAAARRAGLPEFIEDCPNHGPAAHSVAHGRCLKCFTTAGVARVRR